MSKDPAILFYSSDFLTGTRFMTFEQIGKYITLLCLQHQQGHLSYDDILQICGTHDDKIIKKFTADENGFYYNERLDKEIDKRKAYSESRRNNLIKGKNKTHMGSHMENENINTNIDINNNNNKGVVGGKKFKPPTLEMVQAYCKERNNGIDAEAFIDHYQANNWFRGKTKISDWQACVRTWEKPNKEKKKPEKTNAFFEAAKNMEG